MDVLLTNDDGIDAVGIRALHDALLDGHEVTVVAPADDQSAVGRQLSREVELREHELGYAVEGTPTDCVVAGLEALDLDPDVVVAGCNRGANLGEYVLGRSGTVSAAVEAAFFGVPAVAASVYFPVGDMDFAEIDPDLPDFAEATRAVSYLVDHAPNVGVFEQADYLNVNAPLPPDSGHAPMEITRPSHAYDMDAEYDGGSVRIRDRIWERMAEGEIPDPKGSDRRAVVEGRVSVSPLTAPHTTTHHEALDGLAETYGG
ncbi:5'/3'-nucleotidase SurE [Natronomonas marina]|jgi:5'-nucleotidase|uniref:5'/3'-nucleotidase SurE n=1 Tax=Natronomonas marina TaxID=2961939 RepID=UPI0020C93EAE|nr:5'/3'-nucleotidase SurE [Natronomonas marina]